MGMDGRGLVGNSTNKGTGEGKLTSNKIGLAELKANDFINPACTGKHCLGSDSMCT